MTLVAKVKIALLLCGTPEPTVARVHGDYTDMFISLLKRAGVHDEFELDPFDVVHKMEYPSEETLDEGVYRAVMLTGSAASVYDNLQWIDRLVEWTKAVYENRGSIKLIGICFGHQIIGKALGGISVPNDGRWEVGPTKIHLSTIGKKIFGQSNITINQMHMDHVPNLPRGALLLGSTDACINQGMVIFTAEPQDKEDEDRTLKDISVITLQGHPEFTKEIVSEICYARWKAGVIDNATAEEYENRKDLEQDGIDISKSILRIMSGI